MLASIDAAVWQWIATGAVGITCVLLGWMLRTSRERLGRTEISLSALRERTEVIARMCAVTEATISTGLSESIAGLQKDVRELHRKIETSCSELGKKVDGVMGRLLDFSTNVTAKAGRS